MSTDRPAPVEDAIDQLLEGFRRDRDWNDGATKAQLITIFDAMGPGDPVAQTASPTVKRRSSSNRPMIRRNTSVDTIMHEAFEAKTSV